jgi:hypothetical protein
MCRRSSRAGRLWKSGNSEVEFVDKAAGPSPRKIADKGRRLDTNKERDVIE